MCIADTCYVGKAGNAFVLAPSEQVVSALVTCNIRRSWRRKEQKSRSEEGDDPQWSDTFRPSADLAEPHSHSLGRVVSQAFLQSTRGSRLGAKRCLWDFVMSLRAFCIVLLPSGIWPGWLRCWKPSVALVVLDQAIDTSTSAGRLLFSVLSSIAEFERDLIRERTRFGMAAAKWRGKRVGHPLGCGATSARHRRASRSRRSTQSFPSPRHA